MCICAVLMFEFHYNYIKNEYGNNLRLLFTDTDSLMCEIKTGDIYIDFSQDKKMFDFSVYSTKSVVGKMKDKTGGVAIKEIFGLKLKTYSFLVDESSEHKKAKVVKIMLQQ